MAFQYRTELTDEILKSPQAKRILSYLSPVYGDAYAMLWLIQITGTLLDQLNELVEDSILQAFPQTATWSIGRWEEQCAAKPDPEWSLSQRRWAVVAREKPTTPMGPKRLEEIAGNAAGGRVSIQENTGPYRFQVIFWEDLEGSPINRGSACRELEKFKPAHLSYSAMRGMLPVILTNHQAFFHQYTLINWRVKRDIESRLSTLFMRSYLAYRTACEQEFIVGYAGEEKSAVLLSSAVIRVHGSNNLGIVNYALDGRRRLDGSWFLGSIENPGITLKVFRISCKKRVQESQKTGFCFSAGTHFCAGNSTGFLARNSIKNSTKAEIRIMRFHVSVGEKMSVSAREIRDTMWRLDGGVTLDGSKKLNAKMERREL